MRRKAIAVIAGAVMMSALMIPALGLHTGEPDAAALAQWLLLPLKAVVLNLASLAAANGVMVLIWLQGTISHAL